MEWMRLIDADALYEKTADWEAQALHMVETTMHDEDETKWRRWSIILTERTAFKYDVADAPTIEQPEIIRCKDCRYGVDYYQEGDCYCSNPKWGLKYFGGSWKFYCADAKRRTDETD